MPKRGLTAKMPAAAGVTSREKIQGGRSREGGGHGVGEEVPDWAASRPIHEGGDAPDQEGEDRVLLLPEGWPVEARELPENEGEAQGKARKLSGGVQAADEVLPQLKGNSESCGRQPAAWAVKGAKAGRSRAQLGGRGVGRLRN